MIDARRRASAGAVGARTNAFMEYVLSNARTFEEFILNCTDPVNDLDGVKSLTRPQAAYVADRQGTTIVNFVGRFETLEDDFRIVAARLDRPGLKLAHVNGSPDRRHYHHYYDGALAALVGERFRTDIETFGYEF
jgi:hypothetical protein